MAFLSLILLVFVSILAQSVFEVKKVQINNFTRSVFDKVGGTV